jgi:CHAT domain-containing protein
MKLLQLPIKIALVLIWVLISTPAVFAQSGNQSDITGPNPGETSNQTPTEETTTDTGTDTETTTTDTETTTTDTGTDTETTTTDTGTDTETTTTDTGTDTETTTTDTGTDTETTTTDTGTDTETTTTDTGTDTGTDTETTTTDNVTDTETTTTDTGTDTETTTTDNVTDTETTTGETATDTETTTTDNVTDTETTTGETATDTETTTTDNVTDTETTTGETATDTESTTGETATDTESTTGETATDTESTTGETATDTESTTGETATDTESTASDDSQTDSEVSQEKTPNDNESTASDDSQTDSEVSQEKTPNDNESTASDDSQTDSEEVAQEETETTEETDSESSANRDNEEKEETARVNKLTEDREKKGTAATEEEEEQQETAKKENSQSDLDQEVDRIAYEAQVQEAPTDMAIQMQEEFQLTELMESSGMQLYGTVPSVKQISQRLAELSEQTGKKPAFVNISLQENQLESFVVLPGDTKSAASKNAVVASADLNNVEQNPSQLQSLTLRKTVKDLSRQELIATATQFREEVSDVNKINQANYMQSSQKLYEAIIKPIEADLEANNIDVLVFSMDSGLRLIPIAALNDGKQFLIEKYAVALVPSFGLTDTRYVNLNKSSILAMGASEFSEQTALPTMPVELETIVSQPRQGEVFLNEQFTISNFKTQNSRSTPFPIIHLGTHAQFQTDNVDDSYIQFYDDKLKISQLQQLSDDLGWNSDATPVELLVLSACETAIGDEKAELGFAGLAVQAGVKSALASLWYVSDLGTLGLMGEFYDQLDGTLVKAEALRQTQLNMLQGNVKVDDQKVKLSNGKNLALPQDFPSGTLSLSHPYFWSSFTLIGNWN